MNAATLKTAMAAFQARWGRPPEAVAYAPGRIEVLGNHTDYNAGLVLSAAIDHGTFFLAARARGGNCTVIAADVREEDVFPALAPRPSRVRPWANYVKGVLSELCAHGAVGGFDGLFLGDVPVGSGLSSSAALEMSAGLALAECFGLKLDRQALARIGQAAEHRFAGVKCGLLDQISSLYGRGQHLVLSDFRSMDVGTLPLGADACFVVCNTGVRHALVDGAYNERRAKCEEAAAFFAAVLPHPVSALRDVSWAEWEQFSPRMDPIAARRSAHVIGENERVRAAQGLLAGGDLARFGALMYDSHASSINYFENSCAELDFLVRSSRLLPGVQGARLSGGGFGGSVVVLTHPRDAEVVAQALSTMYRKEYGTECPCRLITASDGARTLSPAEYGLPRASSGFLARR
jgi:galactokinase